MEMSALSELQPYLDAYTDAIRKAKNASGYTLQELSDLSGVPYNNICDTNAGRVKQPLLFYAAATCKVLGLSLDKLVGLGAPESASQQQRIHELEIDNTRLTAADEQKDKRLESARVVIAVLAAVSTLLLLAVIGYMIFDAHILSTGLFRSAGVSVFAVFLALLILAALAAVIAALRFLFRK